MSHLDLLVEKVMSNLHQSLIVLDLFVPLVLVRGHVGQHTPYTHLGKEKKNKKKIWVGGLLAFS